MPETSSPACWSWPGRRVWPVCCDDYRFSCLGYCTAAGPFFFYETKHEWCDLAFAARVSAVPRAQDRQRLALRHDSGTFLQVPWCGLAPAYHVVGHFVKPCCHDRFLDRCVSIHPLPTRPGCKCHRPGCLPYICRRVLPVRAAQILWVRIPAHISSRENVILT